MYNYRKQRHNSTRIITVMRLNNRMQGKPKAGYMIYEYSERSGVYKNRVSRKVFPTAAEAQTALDALAEEREYVPC